MEEEQIPCRTGLWLSLFLFLLQKSIDFILHLSFYAVGMFAVHVQVVVMHFLSSSKSPYGKSQLETPGTGKPPVLENHRHWKITGTGKPPALENPRHGSGG